MNNIKYGNAQKLENRLNIVGVYTAYSILYVIVIFGLICLFVVSFVLFIRKLLINSSTRNNRLDTIEEKLNTVIELLKQEK